MPIEEVVLEPGDNISMGCKRLKREEFWYKELYCFSVWFIKRQCEGSWQCIQEDW